MSTNSIRGANLTLFLLDPEWQSLSTSLLVGGSSVKVDATLNTDSKGHISGEGLLNGHPAKVKAKLKARKSRKDTWTYTATLTTTEEGSSAKHSKVTIKGLMDTQMILEGIAPAKVTYKGPLGKTLYENHPVLIAVKPIVTFNYQLHLLGDIDGKLQGSGSSLAYYETIQSGVESATGSIRGTLHYTHIKLTLKSTESKTKQLKIDGSICGGYLVADLRARNLHSKLVKVAGYIAPWNPEDDDVGVAITRDPKEIQVAGRSFVLTGKERLILEDLYDEKFAAALQITLGSNDEFLIQDAFGSSDYCLQGVVCRTGKGGSDMEFIIPLAQTPDGFQIDSDSLLCFTSFRRYTNAAVQYALFQVLNEEFSVNVQPISLQLFGKLKDEGNSLTYKADYAFQDTTRKGRFSVNASGPGT
jgi:hypothetical protein